jgi:hypothetical protein
MKFFFLGQLEDTVVEVVVDKSYVLADVLSVWIKVSALVLRYDLADTTRE